MKLTKQSQNKLNKFRVLLKKTKKKLWLNQPKWSVLLDAKTEPHRIIISYSIDLEKWINGKQGFYKKKKFLYLKNRTLDDFDLFISEIEKHHDTITDLVSSSIEKLESDDSIKYWINKYTRRNESDLNPVKQSTLTNSLQSLNELVEYCKTEVPSVTDIYDIDKKVLKDYFLYKKNHGGKKGIKWSNGTINSNYRRIRAFMNWLSNQEEIDIDNGVVNNMELPKVNKIDSIFTKHEMRRIVQFMNEHNNSNEWRWFIPILKTLLLTGVRISEVVNMKCSDIQLETREWFFSGKSDKERKMIFQDDDLFHEIESRFYDDKGKWIENKKYVFHREYFRKGVKGLSGYRSGVGEGLVVNYHHNYSQSGVTRKFKKMIRFLNLRTELTPQSCRRFYITEMLKSTNGNIPLVAKLVGHSSWDMVKRYSKIVIYDDTKTNLNLKSIVN